MESEEEQTKDITWEHKQMHYAIRHVPYHIYEDYSREKLYSSEVTLKLQMLKDLMKSNEIPSDIDFRGAMEINCDNLEEDWEKAQVAAIVDARQHTNNWAEGDDLAEKAEESFLKRSKYIQGIIDDAKQ